MSKEKKTNTVNDFIRILPINAKLENKVVCNNADEVKAFFKDFKDANIVSISCMQYTTFDVIAFITDKGRAIAVVGKKGSFIALEKNKGQYEEGVEATLGFREDVSHKRFNMAATASKGYDVTYQDETLVPGKVISVDNASDFVQLSFRDGVIKGSFLVESAEATRWTEDWFSIRKSNFESLVIRADRGSLLGAFSISRSAIKPVQFGGIDIAKFNINQPPQGIIPSKILPKR